MAVNEMVLETHELDNSRIAEIDSPEVLINTIEDGLNLMGSLYYQGYDAILMHQRNLTPAFFDLKSGVAGEILQKFSTYRMRLAIVGDFTAYRGSSIRAFIAESNKAGLISFVESRAEALQRLSKN